MSNKEASILIVDDERALRELLASFLGDDYDCVTAAGVDEALALLEEKSFNVVMSDINMPDRSGLELCRIVRQMCPGTAVIMVSAITDTAYVVDALRQGAFDYVAKPFDFDQILMSVDRALSRHERSSDAGRQDDPGREQPPALTSSAR